jgi:hypothetical protein
VSHVRAFAVFCRDLLVGDDWRTALGLVLALVATILLDQIGLRAWWLLPLVIALLLARSLRRSTRTAPTAPTSRIRAGHPRRPDATE